MHADTISEQKCYNYSVVKILTNWIRVVEDRNKIVFCDHTCSSLFVLNIFKFLYINLAIENKTNVTHKAKDLIGVLLILQNSWSP